MDFRWSEEQQALRALAREILEKELTPERLKAAEAAPDPQGRGFDRALWDALGRAQLLGAALPASAGGSGQGFLSLCVLLEEIGRAVAPAPVVATLVMGALPIAAFGDEDQQARLLPGAADGSATLTAALFEPGGTDPAQPGARAERDGAGFRLFGTKTCVPAAGRPARVLTFARSDAGVGAFLLDPRAPGVTVEGQETTAGEPQMRIALDGAEVPDADVLAPPPRGAAVARYTAERATAALCAVQVGVSERALRITADYTRERRQFGRPIGSFQAVHQRAADAYIHLEALRLTTWQAAWRLERGEPAAEEVAVAKFWAAEGGHFVAYAAQHLHGGIGIDVDYPLWRYYVWSKQIELTLGGAGPQLEHLGTLLAERAPAPPHGAAA